jgi:hypothetical protein
VAINDKRVFRWEGDPARLSISNQWGLNDARYLGLGAHRTRYRISRCVLVPLDRPNRPELAAGEVLVQLCDGSLLAAKIDEGQTIVVPLGAAERKLSCGSLAAIRPVPNQKGFRITLNAAESFVVEKLPRQAIHLTTRLGKLAPQLDCITTLERTK